MSRKAVIIDYGLGNLTSVKNAINMIGSDAAVTSDPKLIAEASHIILPGVGSFGEGMKGLRERNLIDVLKTEVLEKNKKILGICLGMQLFAAKGFEFGEHDGMGFIEGEVVKINTAERLPHMGWNQVDILGKHQITRQLNPAPIFYFVHSFHLKPRDKRIIVGVADYGEEVASIVEKGNIYGTQFHPEKSHDAGLQIFKNFLNS